MTAWYGVSAPAKTPRAIVDRLHDEIVRALNTPDLRERFLKAGSEPTPSNPEELRKKYADWIVIFGKIAKDAGLHYVYEGNIYSDGAHTSCPNCRGLLIRRSWHDVTDNRLRHGACPQCGTAIPGVWENDRRKAGHPAHQATEKYSHLNL